MSQGKGPFHADHVGSMIRPAHLIEARIAVAKGKRSQAELREIEDDAVLKAVAMQERVGLKSITDGEQRRHNWRDGFFESVDGFSEERIDSSFVFTEFTGAQRKGMPVPVVLRQLKRKKPIVALDFRMLKNLTKGVPKATLPSPTVNHFFSGDPGFANSPYKSRRELFADITAIYREEVADLASEGCTYLQIDEVPIAMLCDPRNQDVLRQRGEDPGEVISDYLQAINDAIRDRPVSMTVCVHLCRGNVGHGQASGGYDPVAERLFQELNVDGFFLEYDTERSGGFEPLRFVPKPKAVVLGLISTKLPTLEPVDQVKRRIEEASRYVDIERLCISPQCGFASSFAVNRFTADDQERKLAHVVKIADEVWG